MMKTWKMLAASAALALGISATAHAQTTELFFSEYIEGGGNNKALEIFNGTGAAVNLATGVYSIELYSNGAVAPTATQALTGTIANNDVYVIAHASATAAFTGVADLTLAGLIVNFNGDDAVVFKKNGVVIDVFGKVGWDPGTNWSEGGVDTVNQTLVRKNTVCGPNAAGFSAQTAPTFLYNGLLGAEWNESPQDTSSFLGSHTASCSADPIPPNATAIVPTGTGPSNTDKVSFFVSFDEAVQNFDAAADVVINTTGTVTTSGVTITGSLGSYVATVTGVAGNGTLTLAVSTAAAGVEDLAGNDLASSVTSAAVTIANASPATGLLINETWTGASAAVLSTTIATLVADNGWDMAPSAAVGTVQISNFSGDKAVEHTVDGTSAEFFFTAPLLQTVTPDSDSIKIEYETEYNALGTNGSRQWVVQAYASATSLDGYQVRFTGETDSGAVLDIAVIDNGVVGTATDVPPASGAQLIGKRYKVTVVLTKVGSDTLARFQAENLTDGGFIVPAGTQTLAGVSIDAGTVFDTARVFARARTRALLDDVNISFDVTAPVIGAAPAVNVNCGDTYVDVTPTTTDDFDGDMTSSVVVVNPVDVNVPGPYSVTYNVTDASGNVATQVVRTVNVVGPCPDTTPPVITVDGANPQFINCGGTYTELGADVTDNVDPDESLDDDVVIGGVASINTASPGNYTVTYNVNDTAGNPAIEVERTVTVLNNCPVGLIGVNANEGDDLCLTVPNPGTAGVGDFSWTYSTTLGGPQTPLADNNDEDYCFVNVPVNATGFYTATFEDGSKIIQTVTFNLVVTEVITIPVAGFAGLAALVAGIAAAGVVARRRK